MSCEISFVFLALLRFVVIGANRHKSDLTIIEQCLHFTGLENLVINPKPEWLLQMDVSE